MGIKIQCGSLLGWKKWLRVGIRVCRTCAQESAGSWPFLHLWRMARKEKVTYTFCIKPPHIVFHHIIVSFVCTFYLFTGKIPPGSSLIFDIELMDIKNGPRSHDSFKEMDLNDDWKLSKQEVWNSSKMIVLCYVFIVPRCFFFPFCIKSGYIVRNFLLVEHYIVILPPLQVKEFLKKEFEKHGYSSNDTDHDVMVDDIFKNEDEDKDGFISTREFVYQHDEL